MPGALARAGWCCRHCMWVIQGLDGCEADHSGWDGVGGIAYGCGDHGRLADVCRAAGGGGGVWGGRTFRACGVVLDRACAQPMTCSPITHAVRRVSTRATCPCPRGPYLLLSDPNTSVHSPKGRLVATGMEPDSGC